MYLFLAIPNFCGSTLIHSLLETSPTVGRLTPIAEDGKIAMVMPDFVEGNCCAKEFYRNLRGPHSIECNMEHVYNDPANYDWRAIRMMWEENWANTNPYATIKLQKTPADVIRLKMVDQAFPDVRWIMMVRNPYAYVESVMYRASKLMHPQRQLDQICFHVLRMMELQIENLKYLGSRAYCVRYEDFVANPETHRNGLLEWMPELMSLDFSQKVKVKGRAIDRIEDTAQEKIQRMIEAIPNILEMINEYFEPCKFILDAWGYELMQ